MSGRIRMPAPVGSAARARNAVKRLPSAAVRVSSPDSRAPPAIGAIGGRLSTSKHIRGTSFVERHRRRIAVNWPLSGPVHDVRMDTLRFGRSMRALRRRSGLRQVDVAARAGVSDTMISRVERGLVDAIPYARLRRIGEAVGAEVELH